MPNDKNASPPVSGASSNDVLPKDRNAFALAGMRIVVGLFFATFGEYKVFGTQFVSSGFHGYLEAFLSGRAYPFMAPVLMWILAHCATLMAVLVSYGELLIGLSLIFGVLSRIASVFGFALMIAMWLSAGYPGAHAAFWQYWGVSLDWSVFALCFVVLVAGRPEDVWSLRWVSSRLRTQGRR